MANFVADGAKSKGAEVDLLNASTFNADVLANYEVVAFGCPSMGAEVLEESEFQPMWDSVKNNLSDKKVVLFGSSGWGDGEWMRNWEAETVAQSVETCIRNEIPDESAQNACFTLGEKLA